MFRFAAVSAAFAIVAAVSAAAGPSTGVVLKCTKAPILFPDAPEHVWVLDGKTMDTTDGKAKVQEMADKIESVEVSCPESIYRRFAIKSRLGGVVIFTKPGPQTVLRSQVDSVAKLYRASAAALGTLPRNAEELGWRDSTGLITIEIRRSGEANGWTVLGRHWWLEGPENVVTAKP